MAGFDILAAQEIEPHNVETYRHNHGDLVVSGDIRSHQTKERLVHYVKEKGRDVTVIAGGPPCQGFSMAGWFKSDDSRNALFHDFFAIVDELDPKFVLMENVQGLLWMSKGRILQAILNEFEKRHYCAKCDVLKAEEFGVPQLRRRVFIIGSKCGTPRFPLSILWAIISRPSPSSHSS